MIKKISVIVFSMFLSSYSYAAYNADTSIVPWSQGGTGLSVLGSPGQSLIVNPSGTGYAFGSGVGSSILGSSSTPSPYSSTATTTGLFSSSSTSIGVSILGSSVISFTASGANLDHTLNASGTDNGDFNRWIDGTYSVGKLTAIPFGDTTSLKSGYGSLALQSATGLNNVSIGSSSLSINTTGHDNTCVGFNCAPQITTSNANTFVGSKSYYNGTGSFNSSLGAFALYNNTAGDSNTAIGYGNCGGVGGSAGTLTENVCLGALSALNIVAAGQNTLLGVYAGHSFVGGNYNTFVGKGVGGTLSVGSGNILIGGASADAVVDVPTSTTSNFLNIGAAIFGTGVNAGTMAAPSGNIGIGVVSPSARLDLAAGTATTAPLHFNVGTPLATPVNGMVEATATGLLYTATSGTREPIAMSAYSSLNYNNVSSPLTLTFTAADTYYQLSSSSLSVGDNLNVTSSPSGGSFTIVTPGAYTIEYYIAGYASATGKWTGSVYKNGTPISDCMGERSMTATGASAVIPSSRPCIKYLVPGDVLTFWAKSSAAGSTGSVEIFTFSVKK